MIFADLNLNLCLYEMSGILPYVLNPLILLKLIQNIENGVEINNNNINSKLQ
jgi:hypothetical protein